ncbi:hypothetical protein NDN08_002123 [Rhodosorus marinus]|uniref:Uncharacterized protein n=1 Tax=Rhodosorus marinus TaxID=101924 RepID=A0AAV8UX52_9RHOD|nr:hypothetical protein NDN08_002123 [Rhodosorus marinus]
MKKNAYTKAVVVVLLVAIVSSVRGALEFANTKFVDFLSPGKLHRSNTQGGYVDDYLCVPNDSVIDVLNGLLSQSEISLNNLGPYNKSKKNWEKQTSHVVLPGLDPISFDIPPIKKAILNRRYWLYIKDIVSQPWGIKTYLEENPQGGVLVVLELDFEQRGNEIQVECYHKITKNPCNINLLNKKGHFNGLNVKAKFDIQSKDSSPTVRLVPVDVVVDFEVALDSWILDTFLDIIEKFVDVKKLIKDEIESIMMDYATSKTVQDLLTVDLDELIMDELKHVIIQKLEEHDVDDHPIGAVLKNWILGNLQLHDFFEFNDSLCLSYRMPTLIHRNTIRINKFWAPATNMEKICPFQFRFRTVVVSQAALIGTGYIEYANQPNGETFDWYFNNNGIAISNLYKPIAGGPYYVEVDSARLVLKYKGIFGEQYTVKSSFRRVNYRAACELGFAQPNIGVKPKRVPTFVARN